MAKIWKTLAEHPPQVFSVPKLWLMPDGTRAARYLKHGPGRFRVAYLHVRYLC